MSRVCHLARFVALAVLVLAAGCRPRGLEALQRGDQLLEARKPAEAIPLLEVAATDLPGDARAWNFLGLAYHAVGRRPDALKAYLMALRQDRNLFEAHFNLGSLYFEEGNWVEAERSLRVFLAVESNRSRAIAWNLLGQCEWQLHKLEDAERSLTTALKLDPNNADLWSNFGLVEASRRRWPAARQAFVSALRLDPAHAAARLNYGVVSQQLGDRAGALQAYRSYLDSDPQAANAPEVRVLVHQLEGGTPRPNLSGSVTNGAVATGLPATNASAGRLAVAPGSQRSNTAALLNPPKVAPGALVTNPIVANSNRSPEPPPTRPTSVVSNVAPETVRPKVPSEVVPVEDGPRLQAARDSVVIPVPATNSPIVPPAASTNPVATNVASAAVRTETPDTGLAVDRPLSGAMTNASAERKPGFWGRVNPVRWGNPVRWFGSGPKPTKTKAATPLVSTPTVARSVQQPAPPPVRTPTNAAPPSTPVQLPPAAPVVTLPVVLHYSPRAPQTFPAGDRSGAEAQFNAALAAYDRRDLAGAMTLYQQAAQTDPSYFPAHYNLGWAALESGDLSRALLAGESAARLDPASAAGHRLFAAALQRGNYPADAAFQLERVLAAEPSDAAVHFAAAGIYARTLGQMAKAREHYQRVLDLNPAHPQAGAIRVWLASHP